MSTLERSIEYYELTNLFDNLYAKSQEGKSFKALYKLVILKKNILLAYRRIKRNKGAKTPGVDGIKICDIESMPEKEFVKVIRNLLDDYKPKAVKRVWIPKKNGDKRPLGIPTLYDRIVQQCIRQILEPILEAKFFKHSYGFRPMRNASQAIARVNFLINISKCHYVVDVDIKGFFDNVNHNILRKQLWTLGIRDTKIIALIGKVLKAEVAGEGVPIKGTPQGGVLSPLLANVVLNELDQWIVSQWEQFQPKFDYANGRTHRALRHSNLKEGYLVRYADDFKILTKDFKQANRWSCAVKNYIEKHLKLKISEEKSGITNLRKKKSEFLGVNFRAIPKGKRYVACTSMSETSMNMVMEKIRGTVRSVKKSPNKVTLLNSQILGIHNYFRMVTSVSKNFNQINYKLRLFMFNRLTGISSFGKPDNLTTNDVFKGLYRSNYRTHKICNVWLYPLADVKFRYPQFCNQEITPYTKNGRNLYYKALETNVHYQLIQLGSYSNQRKSVEYQDNRLSRYSMVKGRCEVSGLFLEANVVHCHHVKPVSLGGDDSYKNLKILHKNIHAAVHMTDKTRIANILKDFSLSELHYEKLNNLRKKCNLELISYENN